MHKCVMQITVNETLCVLHVSQYLTASATLLAASAAIACSAGSLTRCLTGAGKSIKGICPGPGLADREKLCDLSGSLGSSVRRLCKRQREHLVTS